MTEPPRVWTIEEVVEAVTQSLTVREKVLILRAVRLEPARVLRFYRDAGLEGRPMDREEMAGAFLRVCERALRVDPRPVD